MLKLKELRLSGIGRFVESQTINVESLGSLVQVDGENHNTDGSSGSGKSTLFNALDYLLGLNDLPTTVLQSRLTKDPISVRGVFDWDGKALLITRNKRGLIIDVDGVVTEGSSKLAEEKLTEILGMPNHLFRKMLHKRQKEGGFFLDFTPKQMYEFLTDCLNLTDLRKKTIKIEEKIKELENMIQTADNSWQANNSALKATQDSILALGLAPVKDIHQPVILELKGKYDLATSKLAETQERHKNENQELDKERPQVSAPPVFDRSTEEKFQHELKGLEDAARAIYDAERSRRSAATAALSEATVKINSLKYAIREAETAKTSAALLAEDIKKIRQALCPTCDQSWVTEAAKTKEAEMLEKLRLHKEKIVAGANAEIDIKRIEVELPRLQLETQAASPPGLDENQKRQAELLVLINEQKKIADEFYVFHNHNAQAVLRAFTDRRQALQQKQSAELEQARGQVEVDRRAFDAAVQKLKAYEDARQRYESSLASMRAKEAEYKANMDKMAEFSTEKRGELAKAEELKRALKTYASVSFDEALEVVGDAATRIIRNIPNMSNATIQFEGQRETKEGKVKEEVNAVISMDGEIGIPIKSLSGGERSSVDLAVDLAVIDYLESKTGKGIDLFILDEPFTGLDTVSIENALEVLKNSNINKRLIIVDHNPEVKQMVSSRLVVVRDGQTSNVVQPE